MRHRWLLGLVAALLLVATACGDSDSDGGSSTGADAGTSSESDGDDGGSDGAASDDAASDDSGTGLDGDDLREAAEDALDDLDFGDGLAVITVGDTEYEFSLGGTSSSGTTTFIGVCQEIFGLIAGGGYDSGGKAITVEFEMPPVDWESYDDGRFDTSTPKISIEDRDTGRTWVADMQLADSFPDAAGKSQIDAWESDGSRASGTATFIEVEPFGPPIDGATPLAGTFQLGCSND